MARTRKIHGSGSRRLVVALTALAATLSLSSCAWLTSWFSSKDSVQPSPLPEFTPSMNVTSAWSVSLGNGRDAFLKPAVLDNVIFAAGANGVVQRITPSTGEVQWRTDINARIAAGVGSDGFVVAVATPRGQIVALSAEGKELWRAQAPSDVVTPPLVGRGVVIVRSTDQRISAFEADSGKRRWVYQRQVPALTLRAPTRLSFAGDNVLVGFPAGRLVALALSNGAARWEVSVSEPRGTTEVERLADVVGPTVVAGADVCAAAFQGRVMCADASTGALRWSRELAAGSGVAVGIENVYGVDAKSQVHALARSTGGSLWRNEKLTYRRLTAPAAIPGAVVVGDYNGYVHFLSASDGQTMARLRPDSSAFTATPEPWGDGVVVQSTDGTLALLTPRR